MNGILIKCIVFCFLLSCKIRNSNFITSNEAKLQLRREDSGIVRDSFTDNKEYLLFLPLQGKLSPETLPTVGFRFEVCSHENVALRLYEVYEKHLPAYEKSQANCVRVFRGTFDYSRDSNGEERFADYYPIAAGEITARWTRSTLSELGPLLYVNKKMDSSKNLVFFLAPSPSLSLSNHEKIIQLFDIVRGFLLSQLTIRDNESVSFHQSNRPHESLVVAVAKIESESAKAANTIISHPFLSQQQRLDSFINYYPEHKAEESINEDILELQNIVKLDFSPAYNDLFSKKR